MAWLAVMTALVPLNDFALGNVELYSECFQASGLAVAIVVWAINLFLGKKYFGASVLLSAATFIQLLEGLDVMLVLSAVLFIAAVRNEVLVKTFLQFVAVYGFTAGSYLVLVFMQKNVAADVSNEELFKILFEFRHPHHFIFSAFPKTKMLVFFFLTLLAIPFFSLRSKSIFQFLLIGLAGVIVYAFAVDSLHNVFIGNFQFYKVTQWMKFLGVVAIFGLAEELFKSVANRLPRFKFEKTALMATGSICWFVVICCHQNLPHKVPFQLFEMKEEDDLISICRGIEEKTQRDAVFIQPFENTELKFYAKRSSYVEFKANVRNKIFVKEWERRLNLVYGVSSNEANNGFALQQEADTFFYSLNKQQIEVLKKEGVTHLLTTKNNKPYFGNLVLQNNSYEVYQL